LCRRPRVVWIGYGPKVVHGRVIGHGLGLIDQALAFGTASRNHRLLPRPVRLTGIAESAQRGRCRAEGRHGVPRPWESGSASQDRPLQLPRPPMWHLRDRQVLHRYAYCHWRRFSARQPRRVWWRRRAGPTPTRDVIASRATRANSDESEETSRRFEQGVEIPEPRSRTHSA